MFAQGISKPGELVRPGVEKKVGGEVRGWHPIRASGSEGRDAVRDLPSSNQPLA